MILAFSDAREVVCDGTPLQQLACEMAVREMVQSSEHWACTDATLEVVRFKMCHILSEAAESAWR